MEVVVWRPGTPRDGVCRIGEIQGIERDFELSEAVSRRHDWPDDAFCAMNPEFPKEVALADSLYGASFVVISGRARTFLDAEGLNQVEFLPIRIINHKGRVASSDYFVVNPLDVCDCINEVASEAERNPVAPDSILGCEQLVLRTSAIPDGYRIFRLEHWRDVILLRREIAQRAKAAGLSGLRFIEPSEYNGLI